ncbi:MAG: CHRD domain-containing protein [Bacteroidia bacterium]|nr:CHRD domain-containing protein [Bacteroidia bacterium]
MNKNLSTGFSMPGSLYPNQETSREKWAYTPHLPRLVCLIIWLGLLLGSALTFQVNAQEVNLNVLGTFRTGVFDEGTAEISAYDAGSQRIFFTNADANTVVILDASNPTNPTEIATIDLSAFGGGVNSVAVYEGLVAVAVEADVTQDPGSVVFFDVDGNFLNQVTAGALPDMVTFTPDGSKVLTANEGEPSGDYSVDPEGSITIIDLSNGVANATVSTADFTSFNNQFIDLRSVGIRLFGLNASVAQDLEPEYIAVSPDALPPLLPSRKTMPLAVVDIASATVTALVPLGTKDHSLPGNGIDASDRDNAINIANWPVNGYYMPDAIAAYQANGQTYLVTANEGDAREYDGLEEEARVNSIPLDPAAFPNAAELQRDASLGRLNITNVNGISQSKIFSATLTGDQEVPPVSTSAKGIAELRLNQEGTALSYKIIVYGLDFGPITGQEPQTEDTGDDVVMMHIHNGMRGMNGPVVLVFACPTRMMTIWKSPSMIMDQPPSPAFGMPMITVASRCLTL